MQYQELSEQTRWLDATDQAALVASGEVRLRRRGGTAVRCCSPGSGQNQD